MSKYFPRLACRLSASMAPPVKALSASADFPGERAEFQEFIRRLSAEEKESVKATWQSTPYIAERAAELVEIGRSEAELLKQRGNPLFARPDFDAIVLYAMTRRGGGLSAMEASQLLCYSQAVKTFGAGRVHIHTIDSRGEVLTAGEGSTWHRDDSLDKSFAFFGKGGMPTQLPENQKIFFSIDSGAYSAKAYVATEVSHLVLPGIDVGLAQTGEPLGLFSMEPALVLPPTFLQGLADKNSIPSHLGKVCVNPVLGLSDPEEFTDFSKRDVLVPSSFKPPAKADNQPVPHAIAFYRHDGFHAVIDMLNRSLAEHQVVYEIIAAQPSIGLVAPYNTHFKDFADFYLDREFHGDIIARTRLHVKPSEGTRELAFFLNVFEKMLVIEKEEARRTLIATLARELPKQLPHFSAACVPQHPDWSRIKQELGPFASAFEGFLRGLQVHRPDFETIT